MDKRNTVFGSLALRCDMAYLINAILGFCRAFVLIVKFLSDSATSRLFSRTLLRSVIYSPGKEKALKHPMFSPQSLSEWLMTKKNVFYSCCQGDNTLQKYEYLILMFLACYFTKSTPVVLDLKQKLWPAMVDTAAIITSWLLSVTMPRYQTIWKKTSPLSFVMYPSTDALRILMCPYHKHF